MGKLVRLFVNDSILCARIIEYRIQFSYRGPGIYVYLSVSSCQFVSDGVSSCHCQCCQFVI